MGKKNKKKQVVEDVVEPASTQPKEEQSIEEVSSATTEVQSIPTTQEVIAAQEVQISHPLEAHVDQSITKQESEASPEEVQSTTQEEAKSAPIEVQSIPTTQEETKPAPVEQTMSASEATPTAQQQNPPTEEKPSAWDKLRAWFRKL